MYCYHCGCLLSEYDYCTSCGADVATYKRLMFTANRLYNEGLEKAKVRDLSGAVLSLRQCLKLNKNHVEARNLLGLVYYEMGEVTAALSEWIISQNRRAEKNLAAEYIEMLQSNGSRLSSLKQAVSKYNQALVYCNQGTKDLAIIQLKSVLNLNGRFLRAHLLLALLYIDAEDWEKAERELRRTLSIDRANVQALIYMEEVQRMIEPEDPIRVGRKQKNEPIRYQSDTEMIIQPGNVHEPKTSGALGTVLNIVIGLIVGMAAMYFLVVPAKVSEVQKENQQSIKEISEQLDVKTATIQDLEAQIEVLNKKYEDSQDTILGLSGTNGILAKEAQLMEAAAAYIETGDMDAAAASLEDISNTVDVTSMSEGYQTLYNRLRTAIGATLGLNYYNEGYTAYWATEYSSAVDLLTQSVYFDESNVEAYFLLGSAYRELGNTEMAVEVFEELVERFPGTERAKKAQQYVDSMLAQ